MHHVKDVSAVGHRRSTWSGRLALKPGIAGHTSHRGKLVGSEFYRDVTVMSRGKPTVITPPAKKTAGLIFHECLHNVAPDFAEDQIAALGGYGKSPPEAVMTDKIREHMTTRITTKRPQLLVKS